MWATFIAIATAASVCLSVFSLSAQLNKSRLDARTPSVQSKIQTFDTPDPRRLSDAASVSSKKTEFTGW